MSIRKIKSKCYESVPEETGGKTEGEREGQIRCQGMY
jgi:hypothetical protein